MPAPAADIGTSPEAALRNCAHPGDLRLRLRCLKLAVIYEVQAELSGRTLDGLMQGSSARDRYRIETMAPGNYWIPSEGLIR